MVVCVRSGAVSGLIAYPVEVEASLGRGDEGIVIVGLPDAAVKESRDRVTAALANSGFAPKLSKTTINLAPADVRKEGPLYDLPIAIALLAASQAIPPPPADLALVGELALRGRVRPVKGLLPMALRLREEGITSLICPPENAEEAAIVPGLRVLPAESLEAVVAHLSGKSPLAAQSRRLPQEEPSAEAEGLDFADVKGLPAARRAVEVAVAGGHNILMLGSPGAGKSMLARRIPTILPPLTLEEAIDITRIHSVAGTLRAHQSLLRSRPFRSPHHTISDAGLMGGGTHPAPGEISLAHRGVLFLDELPEFRRNVLEALRQPLEDGFVSVVRVGGSCRFPSRFMLVAAMNPCPCGFAGDARRVCTCSNAKRQAYRARISGPLLDRIDIQIRIPAADYAQLSNAAPGESSAAIRQRVVACRERQLARFKGAPRTRTNAEMTPAEVERHCRLEPAAGASLRQAMEAMGLTARAYTRILKVSRTIADLAGSDTIAEEHLFEAVQYRLLDRP